MIEVLELTAVHLSNHSSSGLNMSFLFGYSVYMIYVFKKFLTNNFTSLYLANVCHKNLSPTSSSIFYR